MLSMVSQPIHLPSTAELPCSDDTPVDNEDQNLLPNLLLFVLTSLWAEQMDWYFGVDMAVYHRTGENPRKPVVPDAFLSLGVERRKPERDGKGRLSYALWEENNVPPILALEMVSQTPGAEYDEKLEIYQRLGVLYYVVYNPLHWQRDQHQPFEVYKLIEGHYQLQNREPCWMPEIGLGIGRGQQPFGGIEMEALLWYDEHGQAHPIPEEELRRLRLQVERQRLRADLAEQKADVERQRAESAEQKAETERQRAERLAEQLRKLGIDPDE